jgi:RNA polymerase sigma-70 factor (ECF subfamily)
VDDSTFQDLINRVRARDEQAAAELVRLYEPEIRRIARIRLADADLRRLLDSADVCQSVFIRFFARVTAGQFELTSPEQLLGLLVTMANNRISDLARMHRAKRRAGTGPGRPGTPEQLEGVADPRAGPPQVAALRDVYDAIRDCLSDEDRYLVDQRGLGREWADIAAEVGGNPENLRKRLGRALDRAVRQLGLDATDHE